MKTMNEMVGVLTDAETSKASFQTEVRNFLSELAADGMTNSDMANSLAAVVGSYKSFREKGIVNIGDKDEQVAQRKQVNNIINDVARICRAETGMTITNVSRKNHTYGAGAPKPRPQPRSAAKVVQRAVEEGDLTEIMTGLIDKHGEDAFLEAARECVQRIKEARE